MEKERQEQQAPTQGLTFTVNEFCDAHRISRAHFYGLVKGGLGPRIMRAGRRTLISREAASDWRKQLEESVST